MVNKQGTIGDILESEKIMVLEAAEKYGDYFINASEFNFLYQNFLTSVDPDRFVFAAFLSATRKHLTLALFSAVRLHHVQAMMDMRQVLEAGASAAFAIANPELKHFVIQKDGKIEEPKHLSSTRYNWLTANFKNGSDAIKNMKTKAINECSAHASLTYAQKNFMLDEEAKKFVTPFFDFEEDHHVKTDLWMIGNVAMGLMDLFYGVCQKYGGLKFNDNFTAKLKDLEKKNISLKESAMNSDWFRRVQNQENTK